MPLKLIEGEKAFVTHDDETTYSVETELIINAPAGKVWDILTDFEKLHEWSPGMVKFDGKFEKNAPVKMTFRIGIDDRVQTFHHRLCYFEDHLLFGWSSQLPHMDITDDHMFTVECLTAKTCKIVQTDQIQGHGAHMLGSMLAHGAMHKYVDFNRALKARSEAL